MRRVNVIKVIFIFLTISISIVFGEQDPRKKTEEMLEEKIKQMRSLLSSLERKYGMSEKERLELCKRIRNKLIEIANPHFYKNGYFIFENELYIMDDNCNVAKFEVSGNLSGNPEPYAEEFKKFGEVKEREKTHINVANLFEVIALILFFGSGIYIFLQLIRSVLAQSFSDFSLYFFLLIIVLGAMWYLISAL